MTAAFSIIEYANTRMHECVKVLLILLLVFSYSRILVFGDVAYAQQPQLPENYPVQPLVVGQGGKAQAAPMLTEEQKFQVQCNPQNFPALNKACGCLMQTVSATLGLAHFNQLEARHQAGQLTEGELTQQAHIMANARPALVACMNRKALTAK